MSNQDCYTFGNCTWYVAGTLGWVPCELGNATDWVPMAQAMGYQVTGAPTVGSVVCYRAGAHYSEFGHVAIVQAVYGAGSFLVSEMNFIGFDQVDQRVSSLVDVEGFILAPGMSPGDGGQGPGGQGSGSADTCRVEWAALQGYINGGVQDQVRRLRWVHDAISAIAG